MEKIDLAEYLTALEIYIYDHLDEITKKVFCVESNLKYKKDRIVTRFTYVCSYFRMEYQRYGRNCFLSKAKLISVYQAIFLSMPNAGIVPPEKGTLKAKNSRGLRRQKGTLSSAYEYPEEKEPFVLQNICILTDYRHIWNTTSPLYARLYLKLNAEALEKILADGWRLPPSAMQIRSESILFLMVESLISDLDGIEEIDEIEKFCGFVTAPLPEIKEHGMILQPSLVRFGKYCRLFSNSAICSLAKEKIDSCGKQEYYKIELNNATENAIISHKLYLVIRYHEDRYYLHDFKIEKCKRQMSPHLAIAERK